MTFSRWLQYFILVPLCGALAVPLTLRVYWGYWWSPPAMEGLTDQVVSLDRFTTFYDESFAAIVESLPQHGAAGMRHVARPDDAILEAIAAGTTRGRFIDTGENPTPGLPRAFLARRIEPSSDEAIPLARYEQVLRALDDSGDFRNDGPGGGPPLEPCAVLFEGAGAAGERVVLAAVSSGQVSNDRYAYCEALFRVRSDDGLEVLDAQSFRYDHAGMEGGFHWYVAAIVTAILLGAWLLGAIVLALRASVRWSVGKRPSRHASAAPDA